MSENSSKYEIIVVGAGPAGVAAACTAAESGCRVAVVDETPWLGGQIWRGEQARQTKPQAQKWFERLRRSGATLLGQTSVIASPTPNILLAQNSDGPLQLHWERLVVATGARELLLPFPGWTLPGIFGPGGLQALAKGGWPVAGKSIVIAGSGPLLLAVAAGLKKEGAKIQSIYEQAPWSRVATFALGLWTHPGKLLQGTLLKTQLRGIPYRYGVWPVKAEGAGQLQSVALTDGKRTWSEQCDMLACGFGLVPNVELPLALGCELNQDFVAVDAWQATSVQNVYCAGEPTGIGGVDCALCEGQIAGYAAAGERIRAKSLFSERSTWHQFRAALAGAFALRPELKTLALDETIVCRCEDVSFGQMKGYGSWRDAKLQTRCGMGSCQGRTCGAVAKFLFGWGMESVRPPILPAKVGSLVFQTPDAPVDSPSSRAPKLQPKAQALLATPRTRLKNNL